MGEGGLVGGLEEGAVRVGNCCNWRGEMVWWEKRGSAVEGRV